MADYSQWSEGQIRDEIDRLTRARNKVARKEERLEQAYQRTKNPKKRLEEVRQRLFGSKAAWYDYCISGVWALSKNKSGYSPSKEWKGNSRDKYDQGMEDLSNYLKKAIDDLDDYRDAIERARLEAKRKSGSYVPGLSELKSALRRWTN